MIPTFSPVIIIFFLETAESDLMTIHLVVIHVFSNTKIKRASNLIICRSKVQMILWLKPSTTPCVLQSTTALKKYKLNLGL